MSMRLQSVYVIPCECGAVIESHTPEVKCKKCGRELVIEKWGKAEGAAKR